MLSLAVYLIAVNVAALVFFTLDFLHYMRTGRDLIDHRLLCLFGVAGGGLGMLAAFLIWDRRVVKDNVAWRFFAIVCVIAWALVVATAAGVLRPDWGSLVRIDPSRGIFILLAWMTAASVATFVLFAVDKHRARTGGWRIREAVLLGCSLAGGALGGIVAMWALRHKIRTWYFKWGLPAMLALQVAAAAYLAAAGVL